MKKLIALVVAVVVLFVGIYVATTSVTNQPTMLITLSASELKEKMDEGENFSLYVYSDDCIYCKQFSPVLEAYLRENETKIYRVATTSPTQHSEVSALLGDKFQATPTLFSFKDGAIADYSIGAKSKTELNEYVQKNLAIFHD